MKIHRPDQLPVVGLGTIPNLLNRVCPLCQKTQVRVGINATLHTDNFGRRLHHL